MLKGLAQQGHLVIKTAAQNVPDSIAANAPALYDPWSEKGVDYGGNGGVNIVRYADKLWRCISPHKSQDDWAPDVAHSLWTVIDVQHSGAIDDPIPAALNMEYFEGKYYSEENTLFYCFRSTGQPVHYMPSALIGHYFEVVG